MNYLELTSQVKNGDMPALPTFVQLKRELKAIEEALDSIKDLAIDEAEKYPEKSFKLGGALIEKKSAACTWDYSQVKQFIEAKERLSYIQKIAQAGGGADQSGNDIEPAVKIEGRSTISIKIIE